MWNHVYLTIHSVCHTTLCITIIIIASLLASLFLFSAQSVTLTYLPDLGVSLGISRTDSAALISVVGISNIIGRLVAGMETHKYYIILSGEVCVCKYNCSRKHICHILLFSEKKIRNCLPACTLCYSSFLSFLSQLPVSALHLPAAIWVHFVPAFLMRKITMSQAFSFIFGVFICSAFVCWSWQRHL